MSALPLFSLDAPMPIWDAGYPAHDGGLRARALTNDYIGQLGYPVTLDDRPADLALARADRPDFNDRLTTFDRAMGLPFRRLPTPPPLPAGFGRNAAGIIVGLFPFSPPVSSTSRVSDEDDNDDVGVLDEDEFADPPSSPTPPPPRRSTRIEKKKLALAGAAKKAKVTDTRTRRSQKTSVKERVALAVAEKRYKGSIARNPDNMKCPFASCGWRPFKREDAVSLRDWWTGRVQGDQYVAPSDGQHLKLVLADSSPGRIAATSPAKRQGETR
ncbi:hypothetical protein AURDEDRAFT_122704 [Auricularia subglabra TFB-10046 SS5]|nr:hypothetical protein AURDEDRAFT_122704 [Auricularia subglabra TFB-10046 SS5]